MGLFTDLFSDCSASNDTLTIPNIPAIMPLGAIRIIETGNLPRMTVTNIMLKKGEQCSFVERAVLIDEKVVKHRDGAFGGVSVRICKGVTFRTGKFGSSPKDKVVRELHKGILYITNRRIVFVGNDNSFAKNIRDLTAMVAETSKVQLYFGDKLTTLFLPNGNLLAKVIGLLDVT